MPKTILAITILLLLSINSRPQDIITDKARLFNKGQELYNKSMYATAGGIFDNLANDYKAHNLSDITNMDSNSLLRIESKYLSLLSRLQLGNVNADSDLKRFIALNSTSNISKIAFFEIGNIYFDSGNYNSAKEWYLQNTPSNLNNLQQDTYNFNLAYCYFIDKDYDNALTYFKKIPTDANKNYNQSQYYIGYINYINGNYDTSLEHLLRVKEDSVTSKNLLTLIGQIYMQNKDYQSIFALYKKYNHKKYSNSIPNDFMSIIASAYFASGSYNNAIKYYDLYLTNKPKLTSQELYQIGYSYYKTNKYDKATEFLKQLITYNDIYAQYGLFTLGNIALIRNDTQDALASFRKAAGTNFSDSISEKALFQLSKLAYENNYGQEALNSIRKFISSYPNSDKINEAKSLLSYMLLSSNNCKEAIELLDGISIIDSKTAALYQKVAYCYGVEALNNNNYLIAIDNFTKTLKYPVDKQITTKAFFWRGEALYSEKSYSLAIDNYIQALKSKNFKNLDIYPQIYYSIAYSYLQRGAYAQAVQYFKTYISASKTKNNLVLDSYLSLGNAYFMLKSYNEAIENYNKVILAKHNNSDYAMYEKALIFGLQNKLSDKIYTLKSLLELYPKSEYADVSLYEMGQTNFILKNYNEAINNFQSLSNYPNSPYIPQAQISLALVQMSLDKSSEALDIYKHIIQTYPNTAESRQAIEAIKNIYIEQGNPDLFFSYIKTIPNIHIEQQSQESISFESGRTVFLNKNYKKAIQTLSAYLNKYPKGYFVSEAMYLRGQSYENENDKDKALSDYQTVIKLDDNNPYILSATKRAANILTGKKLYSDAKPLLIELINKKSNIENDTYKWALLNLIKTSLNEKQADNSINYTAMLLNAPKLSHTEANEANLYMAQALLLKDKISEAKKYLNRINSKNLSDIQANAQYLIAYIEYLKNNYEESQRLCFKIISVFPSNSYFTAKTFLLLAENYYKQGNSFQAIATLQSIVDNYTKNDDVLATAKNRLQELTEASNPTHVNNEKKD